MEAHLHVTRFSTYRAVNRAADHLSQARRNRAERETDSGVGKYSPRMPASALQTLPLAARVHHSSLLTPRARYRRLPTPPAAMRPHNAERRRMRCRALIILIYLSGAMEIRGRAELLFDDRLCATSKEPLICVRI